MAVDYKMHTYRPELFKDTNGRTSYSKMHTWMKMDGKKNLYRPPQPAEVRSRTDVSPKKAAKRIRLPPKVSNGGVYNVGPFAGAMPPVHMRYYKSGGYDDFHKASLKSLSDHEKFGGAPPHGPKVRNGQLGSGWRHVTEVQQARGDRQMYIEGGVSRDDVARTGEAPGGNAEPDYFQLGVYLDQPERIPKVEYDDLNAKIGIECNNWNLLR